MQLSSALDRAGLSSQLSLAVQGKAAMGPLLEESCYLSVYGKMGLLIQNNSQN
jgi:hypothetical protein